jgi:hypothetical protein
VEANDAVAMDNRSEKSKKISHAVLRVEGSVLDGIETVVGYILDAAGRC